MKIIIIESTVYKVTEEQYKKIQEVRLIKIGKVYTPTEEKIISDYLENNKGEYILVGNIDLTFRL